MYLTTKACIVSYDNDKQCIHTLVTRIKYEIIKHVHGG